ncbi:MAG: hypothetical protein N3E37_00680, partial [Candidatus Micrarchaeota archaeon]|nr:hypothetical protein [Candidatus Micrarchaeota archaeon]
GLASGRLSEIYPIIGYVERLKNQEGLSNQQIATILNQELQKLGLNIVSITATDVQNFLNIARNNTSNNLGEMRSLEKAIAITSAATHKTHKKEEAESLIKQAYELTVTVIAHSKVFQLAEDISKENAITKSIEEVAKALAELFKKIAENVNKILEEREKQQQQTGENETRKLELTNNFIEGVVIAVTGNLSDSVKEVVGHAAEVINNLHREDSSLRTNDYLEEGSIKLSALVAIACSELERGERLNRQPQQNHTYVTGLIKAMLINEGVEEKNAEEMSKAIVAAASKIIEVMKDPSLSEQQKTENINKILEETLTTHGPKLVNLKDMIPTLTYA